MSLIETLRKACSLLILSGLLASCGWYWILSGFGGEEGVQMNVAKEEEEENGNNKSSIAKVSDVQWVKKRGKLQFSIKRFGDEVAKNNTIPDPLFLIGNKLLWCPNAKAGTTSMYYSLLFPMKLVPSKKRCLDDCRLSAWRLLSEGDDALGRAVMGAPSLLIVRNPWDRLRSAYVDKILRKEIIPSKGRPRNSKLTGEGKKRFVPMSFVEFVEHVERYPNTNVHWKPLSSRCFAVANRLGQIFHYDHVIRIEDGLFEQVEKIFGWYGLPFPEGELSPRNAQNHTQKNRDGELREFYARAATPEVSMEALVETVGRIYQLDVDLGGYAFPW